jgi:hypothetical protein
MNEVFPWTEVQHINFSDMYSVVKGFNRTPSIPEVAAIFPMLRNGLYDVDNPVFITPSPGEDHLHIKDECEKFEEQGILVCCWHNHVHANTFSPSDVYTLLSRPNLTAVVIDSDDRILVLHKTPSSASLLDKHIDDIGGCRSEALREIGLERVELEVVAAEFFITQRNEYMEAFENMTVDEVMANIDQYTTLQEEIRQVVFAEFREKCGTRYFAMLKNSNNKFLYDVITA